MTPALAAAVALAAGALIGSVGTFVVMARRLVDAEDRLRTVTRLRSVPDRARAAQVIRRGLGSTP